MEVIRGEFDPPHLQILKGIFDSLGYLGSGIGEGQRGEFGEQTVQFKLGNNLISLVTPGEISFPPPAESRFSPNEDKENYPLQNSPFKKGRPAGIPPLLGSLTSSRLLCL